MDGVPMPNGVADRIAIVAERISAIICGLIGQLGIAAGEESDDEDDQGDRGPLCVPRVVYGITWPVS